MKQTPPEPGWPVSVKAVLFVGTDRDRVVLLRNHRNEWELPGGRLDAEDASPVAAVQREIAEELGVAASVGQLIDSHIFEPVPNKRVLILAYRAHTPDDTFAISDEHEAAAIFATAELPVELPPAYRASIMAAVNPS